MADRGQKDDLVDTILDELHAYETLTDGQYDRAWKAFRRMTESDLMLMKVILQKHKMKLQEWYAESGRKT